MVIPFIITYHGNTVLTEWQYRALGLLGQFFVFPLGALMWETRAARKELTRISTQNQAVNLWRH
jgi:hypothetical protein